ncbi:hypothetical protein [Kocuria rhizophila]|uniref:hypothetical protein n=1 Tax=Kocuria rhizophila TaxID=72000 RepID=UPI001EF662AE|nr:hypothetical protein [Kocuria rhizophila]
MRRHTIPLTLAAASLALTGCSAFTPAPAPTVTVTAEPSAEPTTATPGPATEAPAETAQAAPAPPAETPATEPTVAEQAPVPETTAEAAPAGTIPADAIIAEGMSGDDYMVTIGQQIPQAEAEAVAPSILAAKIQELTGTPQAANIDLVAVEWGNGMLLAKQPMPGGKWG